MEHSPSPCYPPKLKKKINNIARQYPNHAKRCHDVIQALNSGTHYANLDGKRLLRFPELIRFKVGQRYRLLVRKNHLGWKPESLLSHERYNIMLHRRC